jgi:ribulose-bisphosphate carboxylase large chain
MNNSTERGTDLSQRFKSGVLPYKQMGYWDPDDTPEDRDMPAVFQITSQHGSTPSRPPPRSPARRRPAT